MKLLIGDPPKNEGARERYRKKHPVISASLSADLKMILDLARGDRSYPDALKALVEKELDPCLELIKNIDFERVFDFCRMNYNVFQQAKSLEEARTGTKIDDKAFLLMLSVIYVSVQNDTRVLDATRKRLSLAGIF